MLTLSKTVALISQENLLSSDLRHIIIDKIIEGRGDPLTMIFPGRFVDIANELNVSLATVQKFTTSEMGHLVHNAFYELAVFQAYKLFFDNIYWSYSFVE